MGKYEIDYRRVLLESLFLGLFAALSFVVLYCYNLFDLIIGSLRNGSITICGITLYIFAFVFLIVSSLKQKKKYY